MELMDENLTTFLERSTGPLPYHSQLNICHDVALAIAYLHSIEIIHRDLSSNNVLLIGEGSRVKVTDFGMSKLMDMNPHTTPLTQVPGTPAYMPPEALTSPPYYSSKLDCFSHGVLALQVITRNFPNPGDATRYVEDPRYPTGRVSIHYPETERRKKDIDLIAPSHPLRPIVFHCLKDRDTQRPSADELCGRLAPLKRQRRYTQSVEQTRGLWDELNREKAEHQKANEQFQIAKGQLQRECEERLQEKELVLQEEKRERAEFQRQRIKEQLQKANSELQRSNEQLQRANVQFQRECIQLQREKLHEKELNRSLQEKVKALEMEKRSVLVSECATFQPSGQMKLTWRQAEPAPKYMWQSATVVRGSTAYLSSGHDVYSYTLTENKWTKLPQCKYEYFAMAVIKDTLTAIGGRCGNQYTGTNNLFSLVCASSWVEVLPQMPTKRVHPAAANTPTHLVVAGGRRELTGNSLATVEVLNTETFLWSAASSLPMTTRCPQMTTCGANIYLADENCNVFTCTVVKLLKSNTRNVISVWARLITAFPTPQWSSLATLRGCVLVIGGCNDAGDPRRAIHCYDVANSSWSVVGEMPTPRYGALVAVLPSNELVVVGGKMSLMSYYTVNEIGSFC